MRTYKVLVGLVLASLVAGTPRAKAGNPTTSLEVVAINGIEVDPPRSEVTIAPGDAMDVRIFLRDWSPDGEKLRAYQATVMKQGYTSGEAGAVKPIGYDEALAEERANDQNAFIDRTDPQWVFHGIQDVVAIVDSISSDYRFLGVIVNLDEALLAPQDGTKFAAGTVRFQTSPDASGTFEIALNSHVAASVMKDPHGNTILPRDYEKLIVHVVADGVAVLRITSSTPPDGAIDARWRLDQTGQPRGGWEAIDLHFRTAAADVKPADIIINDGTDSPPRIEQTTVDGTTVRVALDRGLRPGRWTTIAHKPSDTGVRLAHLPGDVTNDGELDTQDLRTLIREFELTKRSLPAYQYDIDGDGRADPGDILRMIAVLNRPDVYRARLR